MAKTKVRYAKKSTLDADEFDPKHVKVLILIRIDGEVLAAIKTEAQKNGVKYQPLINQLLKERFFGSFLRKICRLVALASTQLLFAQEDSMKQ